MQKKVTRLIPLTNSKKGSRYARHLRERCARTASQDSLTRLKGKIGRKIFVPRWKDGTTNPASWALCVNTHYMRISDRRWAFAPIFKAIRRSATTRRFKNF